MPRATIGQTALGQMLDRLPDSRAAWRDDPAVMRGLDTLESAARALLLSLKANERAAYQALYHRGCPHHMDAGGNGFHCSVHRQDGCACGPFA